MEWSYTPIPLSDGDYYRLEAIANHNAAQKHVRRCRIVLLSVDGLGANAIKATIGKSKTCVWCWQERFAATLASA